MVVDASFPAPLEVTPLRRQVRRGRSLVDLACVVSIGLRYRTDVVDAPYARIS